MDGSPQKNVIGAAQQQPDVMGAMQGKKQMPENYTSSLNQVREMLSQAGITPQQAIRMGDLAQIAIKDKAMYPVALDMAIKEGLLPETSRGEGMNYKVMSQMAVIGEAAKQLVGKSGM